MARFEFDIWRHGQREAERRVLTLRTPGQALKDATRMVHGDASITGVTVSPMTADLPAIRVRRMR